MGKTKSQMSKENLLILEDLLKEEMKELLDKFYSFMRFKEKDFNYPKGYVSLSIEEPHLIETFDRIRNFRKYLILNKPFESKFNRKLY